MKECEEMSMHDALDQHRNVIASVSRRLDVVAHHLAAVGMDKLADDFGALSDALPPSVKSVSDAYYTELAAIAKASEREAELVRALEEMTASREDQWSLLIKADVQRRAAEQRLAEKTTQAAQDVLAERRRQVEVEGYTPEHDDTVNGGFMLSRAAVSYIEGNKIQTGKRPPTWVWPWSDEEWKPSNRRRNLVKAGALILAEIERLDRFSLKASAQP